MALLLRQLVAEKDLENIAVVHMRLVKLMVVVAQILKGFFCSELPLIIVEKLA